jgi:pimeloyl-ACP methyl ester carboxylesterase
MSTSAPRNVVLVHGGFVDGSGWRGVYESLRRDGFGVSIVQNPTLSLPGDADATRQIIDAQDGPVVLVGHSYGGAVITEAGTHPNVAALVYVCAFAPDKGESVGSLIAGFPADGPQPPILPPTNGFLFLDRAKFHEAFAADLPADLAAFIADAQVPWAVDAPAGAITDPAWRTRPSWYLSTTEDRMIPPPAQHAMAEKIGATVSNVTATRGPCWPAKPTPRSGSPLPSRRRPAGRLTARGPSWPTARGCDGGGAMPNRARRCARPRTRSPCLARRGSPTAPSESYAPRARPCAGAGPRYGIS